MFVLTGVFFFFGVFLCCCCGCFLLIEFRLCGVVGAATTATDDDDDDDDAMGMDVTRMLRLLRADMKDLPADVLSAMSSALPPSVQNMLARAQALGMTFFIFHNLFIIFDFVCL